MIYFAGHVLTKTQQVVSKPEAERTHKHTKCQWPARKANAAYSLSDYKQGQIEDSALEGVLKRHADQTDKQFN